MGFLDKIKRTRPPKSESEAAPQAEQSTGEVDDIVTRTLRGDFAPKSSNPDRIGESVFSDMQDAARRRAAAERRAAENKNTRQTRDALKVTVTDGDSKKTGGVNAGVATVSGVNKKNGRRSSTPPERRSYTPEEMMRLVRTKKRDRLSNTPRAGVPVQKNGDRPSQRPTGRPGTGPVSKPGSRPPSKPGVKARRPGSRPPSKPRYARTPAVGIDVRVPRESREARVKTGSIPPDFDAERPTTASAPITPSTLYFEGVKLNSYGDLFNRWLDFIGIDGVRGDAVLFRSIQNQIAANAADQIGGRLEDTLGNLMDLWRFYNTQRSAGLKIVNQRAKEFPSLVLLTLGGHKAGFSV